MAETLAAQLTRVQAAIATIENGAQSISFEGRTITRASLKTLYDREQSILKRIDTASTFGTILPIHSCSAEVEYSVWRAHLYDLRFLGWLNFNTSTSICQIISAN